MNMQPLERLYDVHDCRGGGPMFPRLYKISTDANLVYCYTCIYLLCVLLNIRALKTPQKTTFHPI